MFVVSNGAECRFSLSTRQGTLEIQCGNHFDLVRTLLRHFDRAYLASPFLFEDFTALFEGISLREKHLDLVTSCAARGDDQRTKPFSMMSFGTAIQRQTGRWPGIHVDQRLHSKVYIFYEDEQAVVGVITSANLTYGGLQRNAETGVVITDSNALIDARRHVERGIQYVFLTEYEVGLLCSVVDSVGSQHQKNEDIELGLSNVLARNCAPSAGNTDIALSPSARFFIKVSGTRDRPVRIEDGIPRDEPHPDLSFAKDPSMIRQGDALLEVGVGSRCFLTYYACSSASHERSPEEQARNPDHARWKFYMYGNNCAPAYGARWFESPLFCEDVIAQFKARYPHVAVSAAGADHIQRAINYGHSFLEVTREFGQFVKEMIDARSRKFTATTINNAASPEHPPA